MAGPHGRSAPGHLENSLVAEKGFPEMRFKSLVGAGLLAFAMTFTGCVNTPKDVALDFVDIMGFKVIAGMGSKIGFSTDIFMTKGMDLESAYVRQEELGRPLRKTEDAREAQRAFVEKRDPKFVGPVAHSPCPCPVCGHWQKPAQ